MSKFKLYKQAIIFIDNVSIVELESVFNKYLINTPYEINETPDELWLSAKKTTGIKISENIHLIENDTLLEFIENCAIQLKSEATISICYKNG